MCDQRESRPRRLLVGVGVGPGDPDMITIKALKVLENADVIFVPTTEARADSAGRAEQIVMAHLPQQASNIRRIPFSMAEKSGVGHKRTQAWNTSAEAAIDAFEHGAHTVAFATVGDPSVFSTFSYLSATVCARLDDVDVNVVPGITAMQALAAGSRIPLCEGKEILALVPATVGTDRIQQICQVADCVTIYKGGRQLESLRATLDQLGRLDQAVIGTDIGLPGQRIESLNELDQETAPYFSSVLSAPHRSTTGGQL